MKNSAHSKIKSASNGILNILKRHRILIASLFLLLLGLYYNYVKGGLMYLLINNQIDPLVIFIKSFGVVSAIVFLFIVIVEVVVAPIPSLALYTAGGIIFGTYLGGTIALIGNIIGAAIAFKIARRFGRKYVEKDVNEKKLAIFDNFSKKYGAFTIFLLRINPLTSSDIFSYLAGLTKMPLKHVLLGTSFGLAPLVYVQAYLGNSFFKNNPLLYLLLIFFCIAYLVVFFYGLYYLRQRGKNV